MGYYCEVCGNSNILHKDGKCPEAEEPVILTANSYGWECSCGAFNTEQEIPSDERPVACRRCGKTFTVTEVRHARG